MEHHKDHVKILFRFKNELIEGLDVETMWATVIDASKGLYKIDNIPFYVPQVASEDIVYAEYDEREQMLTYRRTVENSGNSRIHVVMMKKNEDIAPIRELFKNMGCCSEGINKIQFSLEIPFKLDYKPIREKLMQLENQGKIEFAEPCISQKHSSL